MWLLKPTPPNHCHLESIHHRLDKLSSVNTSFRTTCDCCVRAAALERDVLVLIRQSRAKAKESLAKGGMFGKGQTRAMTIKLFALLIIKGAQTESTHINLQEIHIRPLKKPLPTR